MKERAVKGMECSTATENMYKEMERDYTRDGCIVSGWEGESNRSMYEWFGIGVTANKVKCGENRED